MKQRVIVQAVLNQNNNVILLRRSQGRSGLVGKYELPGGAINSGEQPEDAIRRHLKNGMGLAINNTAINLKDVLSTSSREEGDIQYILVVYSYSGGVNEADIKLGTSYDQFEKFNSQTINNANLRDSARLILDAYFNTGRTSVNSSKDDKTTTNDIKHIIYSDGGSRGNPGHSASAYVIYDSLQNVVDKGGEYIGITTNNQAEYKGVLLGLERAAQLGIKTVEFRLDSMLVVNQLKGFYSIKNRELWPVNERIKELLGYFSSVVFIHVPREMNKVADLLVNAILDEHRNN